MNHYRLCQIGYEKTGRKTGPWGGILYEKLLQPLPGCLLSGELFTVAGPDGEGLSVHANCHLVGLFMFRTIFPQEEIIGVWAPSSLKLLLELAFEINKRLHFSVEEFSYERCGLVVSCVEKNGGY